MAESPVLISQCPDCSGINAQHAPILKEMLATCISCGVVFPRLQTAFPAAGPATHSSRPLLRAFPVRKLLRQVALHASPTALIVSALFNALILTLLSLIVWSSTDTPSATCLSAVFSGPDKAEPLQQTPDINIVPVHQSPVAAVSQWKDIAAAQSQRLMTSAVAFPGGGTGTDRSGTGAGRTGGAGWGEGQGSLFGNTTAAGSVAYIVDASGSMRGGEDEAGAAGTRPVRITASK